LSRTEWVKESNDEVDENGKVERNVAPQRYVTAHPEQQWVCWKQTQNRMRNTKQYQHIFITGQRMYAPF